MQDFLQQHQHQRDESQHESLVSLCVLEMPGSAIQSFLQEQLEKIKNIKNSVKRKLLNSHVYDSLLRLQQMDPILNYSLILFSGPGKVSVFFLDKHHVQTGKNYSLRNPFYRTENQFMMDYFQDFFLHHDYQYCCHVVKNKWTVMEMTRTKSRTFSVEGVETLKERFPRVYIHGYPVEKHQESWLIPIEKPLTPKEFFEWREQEIQKKNLLLLERRLEDMQNSKTNLDLYVFGTLRKEIGMAVMNYELKELYIVPKKLEKLRSLVPVETLNFQIIPITSLQDGDTGDRFLKDYNGLMGIRYYS